MRFEDSPGLFGHGVGVSTQANITCDWCHKSYDGREDEDGEPRSPNNVSISFVDFGDLQICDCCFEKIENAVLNHMVDILPWFARLLTVRKHNTEAAEEFVRNIAKAFGEIAPESDRKVLLTRRKDPV